MPKVSIIVPVYNVEKYLERCLQSILNQTFQDWEAICMDDGSTDSCYRILKDFAEKDNRIKVFSQKNQGLSMARNNALTYAAGEYISFLDSDDAMHPQCIEIAVKLAEKHSADMVNFQFEKSDGISYNPHPIDVDKIKVKETRFPFRFRSKHTKYRLHFNVWNKLFRKELINGLAFIPHIHFEDYPYTYAVIARKPLSLFISEPLVFYTINKTSISHQKANPKQIQDYHIGINYLYDIYKNPNLKEEFKFLVYNFIPDILKQQLGHCKRASIDNQPAMFQAFTEELRDLDNKGLIHWRGHKLTRYLTYRKLIKKGTI